MPASRKLEEAVQQSAQSSSHRHLELQRRLVPELCEYVQRELKPDSYITEIAEERVELDTVGLGITPTVERYTVAIDTLLESMRDQKLTGRRGGDSGLPP